MAHVHYPATFLTKDPTGATIRDTYDMTKVPTLYLTQQAHMRSMATLVTVAFILLVIIEMAAC